MSEQDQTVQSEEIGGDILDGTDTPAVTEETGLIEKEEAPVSIEDIAAPPQTDTEKAKEGTPPWYQKRIDQMAAQKNAAIEEAKKAKEKIAQLEIEKAVPVTKPLAPVLDDFGTTAEYQQAMDKWQSDVMAYNNAQSTSEARKAQEAELMQEAAQRFETQVESLKTKYPDVLDRINSTVYGNSRDAIQNSGESAKIALYLNLNPKELARINSLPEKSIYLEVGKLEQRIANAQPKPTGAPGQLNTLRGTDNSAPVDTSKMSDEQFYANWQKQKLKRLKAQLEV